MNENDFYGSIVEMQVNGEFNGTFEKSKEKMLNFFNESGVTGHREEIKEAITMPDVDDIEVIIESIRVIVEEGDF